jgi:TonB family protein
MRKYLRDNLTYPEAAREKGHEGTVFVDFTVGENGKIRDVVASEIVGDNVDISFKVESVRVVAAMPGWKAGRQNGKAVDASFSIPITFQLDN